MVYQTFVTIALILKLHYAWIYKISYYFIINSLFPIKPKTKKLNYDKAIDINLLL